MTINWSVPSHPPWEISVNNSKSLLTLKRNYLSGTIPYTVGNLGQLIILDKQGNKLTGSIPSELGNLGKLNFFLLSVNQLSGTIPSTLGNLSVL
jgi:hypothetical protein